MKSVHLKTSDYLKTKKDVVAYLNAVLEDGDSAVLLEALRNVAQTRGGMGALAKAAGVSRESLYRTLSRRGNPKIETVMELMRAARQFVFDRGNRVLELTGRRRIVLEEIIGRLPRT